MTERDRGGIHMRWRLPEDGDHRHIEKFLWFPVRIGSDVRWLEKAVIHQVYFRKYYTYHDEKKLNVGCDAEWVNQQFID